MGFYVEVRKKRTFHKSHNFGEAVIFHVRRTWDFGYVMAVKMHAIGAEAKFQTLDLALDIVIPECRQENGKSKK
jgi:hypothetical protein